MLNYRAARVDVKQLVKNTVFEYTVQKNSIYPEAHHDHTTALPTARHTNQSGHASLAYACVGLVVSSQAPQSPVKRSQTGAGGDLLGGLATDFVVDWVHAYGVMRIEVKAGQVYVDGRVVRPAGKDLDASGQVSRAVLTCISVQRREWQLTADCE